MKIKNFFKDYKHCLNEGFKFYRNHWLGSIIFSIVISIVELSILYAIGRWDEIKGWFHKKFHKKNKYINESEYED